MKRRCESLDVKDPLNNEQYEWKKKEKPILRYIPMKTQKSKDQEKISDFQREKNGLLTTE